MEAILIVVVAFLSAVIGFTTEVIAKAIKKIQLSLGMDADGFVGPVTRHNLESMTKLLNIIYNEGSNK